MDVLGREVVIVEAVRTPIGRGHPEKGRFRDVHPATLLAATYTEVLARAGRRGPKVDDVLTGCVQQYGEQSFNIGRNAWLQAGLPYRDPGDDDRPSVRVGPAGRQFRRHADRERRPRHHDRLGRRADGAASRCSSGASSRTSSARPFTPELLDHYDLIDQGFSAEMIAEQWRSPARAARRDRRPLAAARRAGRGRRAASTARSSRSR